MDARHRYLALAASDAFNIANPNAVESAMSECMQLVDSFWESSGPPVLFFTYQPDLETNEAGAKVCAARPAFWCFRRLFYCFCI